MQLRRAPPLGSAPDLPMAAAERAARHAALEASLHGAIAYVLRTVNERKEHIPPVVSGGLVSFPFDIALPEDGSYAVDTLKRLVTAVRPPVNVL